jgi:catalase
MNRCRPFRHAAFAGAFLLCHCLPLNALAQQTAVAAPSSARMVDALNSVFHAHAHARANHANGMLLTASFTPAPAAAGISKAPHFQTTPTSVLVRFSNFGGIPDIGDADPGAAPYGMSLKFLLGDDRETDLVMHSFNGFPSATAADFVDFLTAMGNSPAGTAHPNPLESYAAKHPQARAFLAAYKPAPAGFGTQSYFGVNTFKFTNAAGMVSYGRYRMVPLAPARYLSPEQAAAASSDYLRAAMRRRLADGPVRMRLELQMAEAGDALEDPSIAWPESRRRVELGTLTINAVVDHAENQDRSVVFFPDELPDGIEVKDPMLKARTRAYAESLERRLR